MRELRRAAVVAATATIAVVLAGCGGSDATAEPEATAAPSETQPDESLFTFCDPVAVPAPRQAEGDASPAELDPDATYRLVVETNCGSFTITLDQQAAPETSASLVQLARDGYFDGTIFHRIVPGFVIQGGDPSQTGGGGPGYTTVDEPPADARYVKGVVAMAKAASEAPGTAGSQFFVVTGADVGLPPEYAVVGKVTAGLTAVERIGELGDPASELPLEPVVVTSATVEES
ncbi:MAG: peptidylprolyl isomerase [Thermoleophilia bacterium]|nr:peptidylprolyl isomerase [Thermoleophilia bacterium]